MEYFKENDLIQKRMGRGVGYWGNYYGILAILI